MTVQPLVLEIEQLVTVFDTPDGSVRAVDGFDISIGPRETVALVGESGSGKSVTCLSIMGLLPQSGRVQEGTIRFMGEDLVQASDSRMRKLRGSSIAMIFQEPMTSLNPVFRVGKQISETIRAHLGSSAENASKRAIELLDLVGIPEAGHRARNYPHELSGGMRQRVMIAIALACEPKLLIADEPTTALDVTVQAQILELLRDLQSDLEMAVLFVTHDLGVVAGIADRVYVMYAGQGVESGKVLDVYRRPLMPYTEGLLLSIPQLVAVGSERRLPTIEGQSPSPGFQAEGCAFLERCKYARDVCGEGRVKLETREDRSVRCRRADELVLSGTTS